MHRTEVLRRTIQEALAKMEGSEVAELTMRRVEDTDIQFTPFPRLVDDIKAKAQQVKKELAEERNHEQGNTQTSERDANQQRP